PALRVYKDPFAGPPEVHLLSNGRYHVVITNAGSGYSRWNDLALTRWHEDPTRDCWGTFFYLRDTANGNYWSPACQPVLQTGLGYEAVFSQGRAEFRSRRYDIDVHTQISVSPEDDVEVRRLKLTNRTDEARTIEVTSYAEVVLNSAAADHAHPAFSNLFVQTKLIASRNAIICTRRARTPSENPPWMFHLLLLEGIESGDAGFETDRAKFIGRGGDPAHPAVLTSATLLSGSAGSVLDPIAALRRTVRLEADGTAAVTLVAGIAPTEAAMMALLEKYQDPAIAERSFDLAWTHGLIVLRHLNAAESDAQLYGRLAGALIFSQGSKRAAPAILKRNRRGQRNLWSFGISGDLPIVLVHGTRSDRVELVRQLVQAHSYWRFKGLAVDLVVLAEEDGTYRQPLYDLILTLIASSNAAQWIDKPGGIFVRRVDQLSAEDRVLLETAARVVLHDEKGPLNQQLQRRARAEPLPAALTIRTRRVAPEPAPELEKRDLIFFNGLGGFTRDGREYVITLPAGAVTPAPWVNVLANPSFGTLISERGSAYTWSENCHEFRLTPWHNDPVKDPTGEALYVRDEETGRVWSPGPHPARGDTPYVSRHGFGYSVFEHHEHGIGTEWWVYTAVNDPIKFNLLKLHNHSGRRRRLSVTAYCEWVLGELRAKNAPHIVTEHDAQANAISARNPFNSDFGGRIVFAGSSETLSSHTGDRTEFLGRNGHVAHPAALGRARLSGRTGPGFDPCAALQAQIELAPGEEREIVFSLGAEADEARARQLLERFRTVDSAREALEGVWAFWNHTLSAVRVETPEPAVDILANGWLVYQALACRLWARTGFYQSGGA
ncbi:MAG TPA: cyclic beta 1-2 glucan synthetase, partial [Candidatus Binatia bacterium]|nr:cyclic beta 1-2 glucan synthetase [Candidatus Binatia bacterium]